MKKFVVAVLSGLKREIDSAKAIGSMEVGVTCEEPNVLELDEYAEELQNVFDNISGVRLDPDVLSASRKVEIDLRIPLGRAPRATKEMRDGPWQSCHLNEMGRCEQRRLQATRVPIEIVRERTYTLRPNDARNVCIDGTIRVRDVLVLQSAVVETRGQVGATTRKILFLHTSRAHCQAEATSEMAIEMSPEEQV